MKTILALAIITTANVTTTRAEKISIALKSGGSMTGLLVGKSATEIKVETDYGIITLHSKVVTRESWATAHRATTSKPTGKYIVPNPSPKHLTRKPLNPRNGPETVRRLPAAPGQNVRHIK